MKIMILWKNEVEYLDKVLSDVDHDQSSSAVMEVVGSLFKKLFGRTYN